MYLKKQYYVASVVALSALSSQLQAKELDEPVLPSNATSTNPTIVPAVKVDKLIVPTQLATDSTSQSSSMTKEQTIEYLRTHPDEMENVLSELIKTGNVNALEELLPIYATYPQRDESLIDWGNAMIAQKKGNVKKAITLYRKLNAAIPSNRTIRLQLAGALYNDGQLKAAKLELERLRSDIQNPEDIKLITTYIEAIDHKHDWNFNASFSFLNEDNLGDAPKVGAKVGDENSTFIYNRPHEKGMGISYNLGADKKWALSDRWFTALHINTDGSYYWDNKKFNDASLGGSFGIGYQNTKTEIELAPMFNQRWYGGGISDSNDDSLKRYTQTKGINLSLNQWLSPHWLFQNYNQFSNMDYEKPYDVNNADFQLFSNSLVYLANQNTSFIGGFDYLTKDSDVDKSESFKRHGVRLGWNQAWRKGISTRVNLGVGNKNFESENFSGIKRENREINAGISVWKRDLHLLGLTPRVTWDYKKIDSNSALEERNENNFNLIFTKTF